MAQQIRFFKKNIIDLDNDAASVEVTDSVASDNGSTIIDFIRNRNNVSAWLTTGSTDAANTTLEVQFGVGRDVTDIILIKHNWKAFTIKYWDGDSWEDFSTPIAETTNSDETSHFSFTSIETTAIQIIITGAQVVDDDKELYQLIITDRIGAGQLAGWPIIRNPIHDTNKRKNKMLSGKVHVVESVGSFAAELTVSDWRSSADLTIVEDIYFRREAVLLWLCGGDEDQFTLQARGYRKEDIYLVRPVNNYEPEWVKGIYRNGLDIKLQLQEAIE